MTDRRDLLRYIDQVKQYNRQAKSWGLTKGVECAPVNHLEWNEPDILRELRLQGINVCSHGLLEQWLMGNSW